MPIHFLTEDARDRDVRRVPNRVALPPGATIRRLRENKLTRENTDVKRGFATRPLNIGARGQCYTTKRVKSTWCSFIDFSARGAKNRKLQRINALRRAMHACQVVPPDKICSVRMSGSSKRRAAQRFSSFGSRNSKFLIDSLLIKIARKSFICNTTTSSNRQ